MKNLKKISFSVILLVFVLALSAFVSKPKPQNCETCNSDDELQRLIQSISQKAKNKNGYLVQSKFFPNEEPNSSERRIIWQGSYSYCGGECFAIVTVTANCLFGYCWGYGYSQVGNENCPCGDL